MKTKTECQSCYVSRRWRENDDARAKMSAAHRRFMDKYKTRQTAKRFASYLIDSIARLVGVSNRNAKQNYRGGIITTAQLTTLFTERFHDYLAAICPFCASVVVAGANASVDHKRPDGSHTMRNIRVVCISCNSSRGRLVDAIYRKKLAGNEVLLSHIRRRNDERLGAFLVSRYMIPLADIETLVERIKAVA